MHQLYIDDITVTKLPHTLLIGHNLGVLSVRLVPVMLMLLLDMVQAAEKSQLLLICTGIGGTH